MSNTNAVGCDLSVFMSKDEFFKREKSLNISYQKPDDFSIYVFVQGGESIDIDTDLNSAIFAIPTYIDSIGYNLDVSMSKLFSDISSTLISSGMPWELYLEGPTDGSDALLIEFLGYAKGTEMHLEDADDLPKPIMEFGFNVFPKGLETK